VLFRRPEVGADRRGWTLVVLLAVLPPLVLLSACSKPLPLAVGLAADDVRDIDAFVGTTGAPAAMYEWFQSWAGDVPFDAARADAARTRGALPVLTWEPWYPGGGADQPAYALDRIIDGEYDDYIAAFAGQVRRWGGRLGLRFMHELNAAHYPWGAGVNGNTAEQAVAAWQHVRRIFAGEGAGNAVWIWCVNVHAQGTAAFAELYPGDDAVDWVALDGYNGGTALPWGGWRSPEEVFGTSLDDLRALSRRPLVITEVGSAEQGGSKAGWIRELFDLAVEEGVRGLIWFQYDKEADWRVQSTPAAAAAFRRAAGVPGRLGPPPLR
jgi:glycosyl hydrolase family 26